MSISSEDLAIGREVSTRINNYGLHKPKRLTAYLIPLCWLVSSIVRYEARANLGYLIQIIFWSIILIIVSIYEYKRRRTYLHDLTTLEELRRQHGADISFEEENVATNAGEKAGLIKDRDEGKKLKRLFAFGIFLAAAVIIPLIFHYFGVAFSK